jgi:hypothetical protein
MTNSPMADDLISTSSYCTVGPGLGQITFSWLYQDPNNDPQSQYWLQVATDPQFNNLAVDCTSSQPGINPGQRGSATVIVTQFPTTTCPVGQIAYNTTYYWRVKVRDSGLWSEWATGTPFTTPIHPYPWPEFTWSPERPIPNDILNVTNTSQVFPDRDNISESRWIFENCDPNEFRDPYPDFNSTWTVVNRGVNYIKIILTVTDREAYSCTKEQRIDIGALQLPPALRYQPIER